MRTPFTGVGTALVTPFRKDGSVDEAAVRHLARRQIDGGVHFVSPVGTTGEAPTLSHAEKLRVIELVVEEVDGRVPVLAGAGGYDTRETIALIRDIGKIGADGILSVTPYYNKPTQEGLYQHYRAIAESTPLPIVLYNVPGRTGVNLEAATTVRLSAIPNIVGVKEASGNVVQAAEIIASAPEDFIVVSGDDALTLAIMVTVVVSGDKQLHSITIDPEVVSKDDVEMLQDLILAAINDAHRKVDDQLGQQMQGLMGGLKIPGL